ncbi:MAG: hypothetical protein AB8G96_05395 [Phycisphaerales bacterium]
MQKPTDVSTHRRPDGLAALAAPLSMSAPGPAIAAAITILGVSAVMLAAGGCSTPGGDPPASAATTATPTPTDDAATEAARQSALLAAVTAQRERISDLAWSGQMTDSSLAANAINDRTFRVDWTADRVRIERVHQLPGSSARSARVISVWDGDAYWQYFAITSTATRITAPNSHYRIDDLGLPEVMMWWPAIEGMPRPDRDLAALLADPAVVVNAEPELVDGHACIRVDVPATSERSAATFWLDPERDHLPRRQRHAIGNSGTTAIEIHTTAFSLVGEVWFATAATRSTPALPGGLPETAMSAHQRIEIDVASLAVNTAIDPGRFDLRSELPSGTMVSDGTKVMPID